MKRRLSAQCPICCKANEAGIFSLLQLEIFKGFCLRFFEAPAIIKRYVEGENTICQSKESMLLAARHAFDDGRFRPPEYAEERIGFAKMKFCRVLPIQSRRGRESVEARWYREVNSLRPCKNRGGVFYFSSL